MTKEEHDLLVENNKLLRLILQRLSVDKVTPEEFVANVLANLVSQKIDAKK